MRCSMGDRGTMKDVRHEPKDDEASASDVWERGPKAETDADAAADD